MRSSSRGFFLIDALLCVFILSCICILCFSIWQLNGRYEKGLEEYRLRSDDRYEMILRELDRCQGCKTDESD